MRVRQVHNVGYDGALSPISPVDSGTKITTIAPPDIIPTSAGCHKLLEAGKEAAGKEKQNLRERTQNVREILGTCEDSSKDVRVKLAQV